MEIVQAIIQFSGLFCRWIWRAPIWGSFFVWSLFWWTWFEHSFSWYRI